MPLEAQLVQEEPCTLDYTPVTALTAGQVIQVANGQAGVPSNDLEAARMGAVDTKGLFRLAKAAGINILKGGRVYWDHSHNVATFRPVNDRDFYVGTAVEDSFATATTVVVNLNAVQVVEIDLMAGPNLMALTGTFAAGGFGYPIVYGASSFGLQLTATNEVQKADLLSVDRRAVAGNGIAEFQIRLGTNGSTSDVDFNFGLVNGTHGTDADAITEHVLFHVDGGALDLFAQSKDGTTTVAAVDTTVNLTAGVAVSDRVECWIDTRNPADVQLYVNGVNVLPDSVFRLDAATGPLGLLAHLEKTAGAATAGPIRLDKGILRTAED